MKNPTARQIETELFNLLNLLLEGDDISLYPERNSCEPKHTKIIASTPEAISQIADIWVLEDNLFRIGILNHPFTFLSWKTVDGELHFSFNSQSDDPKVFLNFHDTMYKSEEFRELYHKVLEASLYR